MTECFPGSSGVEPQIAWRLLDFELDEKLGFSSPEAFNGSQLHYIAVPLRS